MTSQQQWWLRFPRLRCKMAWGTAEPGAWWRCAPPVHTEMEIHKVFGSSLCSKQHKNKVCTFFLPFSSPFYFLVVLHLPKKKKSHRYVPVEAATAPIKTEGIPRMDTRTAAPKQHIWAFTGEAEDRILWWKHWNERLPKPWGNKVGEMHDEDYEKELKKKNKTTVCTSGSFEFRSINNIPLTIIKNSSIHLPAFSLFRVPSQGFWNTSLKAVSAMLTDTGLVSM